MMLGAVQVSIPYLYHMVKNKGRYATTSHHFCRGWLVLK
jgi:hypothetical protein